MASSKSFNSTKKDVGAWKRHDTYNAQISYSTIVTRSQTVFCRIKNDDTDLDLFGDKSRHQPPGKPHLMSALKGKYGSVPRTIVTRSTAHFLEENPDLAKALEEYKKYVPTEKEKELAAKQEDEEVLKLEGSEPKPEAKEPEPKEAETKPKEEPKPKEAETEPKEEPKPKEAETKPKEETPAPK